MYFHNTRAIKGILKNRMKSPVYYRYLGTGFDGMNAEFARLEKAKKESKTREEYEAIEKEISDLRFLSRNKQRMQDANVPFVTEEEHQRILSKLEEEEKQASAAVAAIHKEMENLTKAYVEKMEELQAQVRGITEEAKSVNLSTFPFMQLFTQRPHVTGHANAQFQQLINAARKVGK